MKMTLTLSAAMLIGLSLVASPAIAEEGLGGDIIFTKPVKGVLFTHKAHVEEAGMSCNLCHDKLFQMMARNAQENPDFNHKAFKMKKYCGACHDGKMGFSMESGCTRCHTGVKGLQKAKGN